MAYLSQLGRFKNTGLLLIRIGVGLSFIFLHGYPKLIGGLESWEVIGKSMGNLGIGRYEAFWGFSAGLTETLGGLFVVLGLFFRPTCIALAFIMVVAAFHQFSVGGGWFAASHPLEIGTMFIGLLLLGPGKYSVDQR